jgi:GntR family transcriptional repressor for pyruvate dehydrogenase complex
VALTDEAIAKIKELIRSGELRPGARLPPEQQLGDDLGISRGPLREAIKALEMARVIDVRQGAGTYVTSLAPKLLLEGFAFAVELLQDDNLLDVMETRRLLEPAATALAASRISDAQLDELRELLDLMRVAVDDEKLVHYDAAFHRIVAAATGNETLTSVLEGLSSRTLRARVWRGMIEGNVSGKTVAEHEAIYQALRSRDQPLAFATAHMHVNTSEAWLRTVLQAGAAASAGAAAAVTGGAPV